MNKLIAGTKRLGLQLSSQQIEQFQLYFEALIEWNKRLNLTRITDYEEVQVKHFLDSLTVALAWQPQPETRPRVLDVGTGAGLPGLPLKIAFPAIRLVLLEATAKKTLFLRHVTARLGLGDVEIVAGRAEEVAHQAQYRDGFDLVLSRAVAALPALAELTLPFAAVGGLVIAQKKGAIAEEVASSATALGLLGSKLREVKRVELEELPDERYLVVIDKTAETPARYPRRPGIPARRPLG
ncbi:MAG: 16S rRNA (guanine(527)-N(7))-methyltransferase RsmG [Chloroflexi bacterium]|nr:16S rRNA (guanine(527)-N(7))-methyltransferase RsmG [Chloroflexota bacterium]